MIRYLTERELVMINTMQIQRYSPDEQIGVKEPTALNMCVSLPKQDVFGKELYQLFLIRQRFFIKSWFKNTVFTTVINGPHWLHSIHSCV